MNTGVLTCGQERVFCGDNQQPSIAALGRQYFCPVFDQPLLREKPNGITLKAVISCFLSDELHRDRSGELVDISILARIVHMCRDISIYMQPEDSASHFIEAAVLKESRTFFRKDAEFWLSRASIGSYCKHVAFRIGGEAKRNAVVFGPLVADAATGMVVDEFIR
jgi:cullin 3